MKILRWDLLHTDECRALIERLCKGKRGTALTIGGFDGPHMGHEALFSAVSDNAASMGLAPGIVTFAQSPGARKKGENYPGDVSTLNLRLSAFETAGFDFVLLIDFSIDFSKMTGGVFFEILVKTVCMRYLAVGPDFRCGHRLDTGVAEIMAISKRDGFRFDSIRQIELEGMRISSSAIRKAVQSADFALAERLLGHPFLLDFTAPTWLAHPGYLEASAGSFSQILPRRGRYSVVLTTVRGDEASAILVVADEDVTLMPGEGKSLPAGRDIATVEFRLS